MKLYIDNATNSLVTSATNTATPTITLFKEDISSVEIRFVENGSVVDIGTPTIRLALGKNGSLIAFTDSWTKNGTGASAKWTGAFNLNTQQAEIVLAGLSSTDTILEVEVRQGAEVATKAQLTVTLKTDLINEMDSQTDVGTIVAGVGTQHIQATTNVHGISNTANLVLTNDSRISTIAGGSINTSGGTNVDPSYEIFSGDGMGAPGGSIDLRGGNGGQDGHASSGGLIQLRGADGNDGNAGGGGQIIMNGAHHDGHAGSIIANGATNHSAGSLNMSAFTDESNGDGGAGGSINTSGGVQGSGGSINTSGGAESSGGSINTSNGGGSINTSLSGGSIQLQGSLGDDVALGGSLIAKAGNGYLSEHNGGNGGTLNLSGGNATEGYHGDNGGSINLSAGGGSINSTGFVYVDPETYNVIYRTGGSINLSSDEKGSGGSINTSNGGGSINTLNGGGSIETRGTGSIQLGVTGTRTTLHGSASGSDKTITLPNETGVIALTPRIAYGGIISASAVDAFSGAGTYPMIQGSGVGGSIRVASNGVITIASAGTGYVDGLATKAGGSRFNLVTQATTYASGNLPIITKVGGGITTGTFGTTANTFCQGDDARLSSPFVITMGHSSGSFTTNNQIGYVGNYNDSTLSGFSDNAYGRNFVVPFSTKIVGVGVTMYFQNSSVPTNTADSTKATLLFEICEKSSADSNTLGTTSTLISANIHNAPNSKSYSKYANNLNIPLTAGKDYVIRMTGGTFTTYPTAFRSVIMLWMN